MDKNSLNVAVLYGGRSAEPEVSLRSGQAVLRALPQSGNVGAIALTISTGRFETE